MIPVKKVKVLPTSKEVEKEIKRVQYKAKYRKTLKSTLYALITAAAAAVLVATLWLPVLQIYGSSMAPALTEGEIVVSVKTENLKQGDIIAFYYGNKVLVKRYIAGPGQWIDIREDGTVYVDNVKLDEPYYSGQTFATDAQVQYPFTVSEDCVFVMGDNRGNSTDSRSSRLGEVDEDAVLGKAQLRIFPFNSIGKTK